MGAASLFDHFSSEHIERDALCGEIPQVLAAWTAAALDGAPDLSAFNPDQLPAFAGHLMMAEKLAGGDFMCRRFGADLARHSGFDLGGALLSSVPSPDLAALMRRAFDEALALGKPVLERHYALRSTDAVMWEALLCPVRSAGRLSTVIGFCKPVEFRNDLLGAIVDGAPMGVQAYRVLRDGAGKVTDARLVLMNQAAASIVGQSSAEQMGKSIFDLIPTVVSRGIWERYVRVVETRQTEHYESRSNGDPDGPWLRLTATPWGDGLIVMFTDITEIRRALDMLQEQARDLRFQVGVERASRSVLAAQLQSAVQRERALLVAAQSDSLTKILNRRGFEAAAAKLIESEPHGRDGVYFALIDIDHFKTVNDRWGHAAGDEVLKTFAERLTEASAVIGAICARIGGEEFALCIRLAAHQNPDEILGDMQQRLTTDAFPLGNGLAISLTCSVGFSALAADEPTSTCVARADAALYDAKRFGRNRVSVGQAA